MQELDAIVLALGDEARVRVAGLTAAERARRVVTRVGASRVVVVEDRAQLADLARWREERGGAERRLLVVQAGQLVHPPLVQPLMDADPREGVAIATVPDAPAVQDLTVGSYAGALVANGAASDEVVATLIATGGDDRAVIASMTERITLRVPHGHIARAPLRNAEEVRAAHRVLYRILIKPQDSWVTNYLFRPISNPITRMLVWTGITPNWISYCTAVVVTIGCIITAHADFHHAILGTIIVLSGSYIDCCDGEVARVKLLSSKLGAWVDTIVDELSSIGYMIAVGAHCYLHFDSSLVPWRAAIVICTTAMLWSVYCIYYNIIVAVGSANSQDYVGRFEVVPGREPGRVRLAPAAPKAIAPKKPLPEPLQTIATNLPYMVRRDFISWLAVVLAVSHLTYVSFGLFFVGSVVSFLVLTVDHIKLRSLRRSVARRGMLLEAP